jgi:hypothetical protein
LSLFTRPPLREAAIISDSEGATADLVALDSLHGILPLGADQRTVRRLGCSRTLEKSQNVAEKLETRKKTSGSVQVPGGLGTIRRSRKVRHIKMRLKCDVYFLSMGCGAKSLRDCSCTEVAIDSLPIQQGLVLSYFIPTKDWL